MVDPSPVSEGRTGLGRFSAVAVRAMGLAIGAVLLWAIFLGDGGKSYRFVYDRYNDALVAGNIEAAWRQGCPSDRDRVPQDEFAALVARSVRPLGELESWSRLRGGPEWHGTRGDAQRLPEIDEEDGDHCVRFGNNALGDPF